MFYITDLRVLLINPPNPKNFVANKEAAGGFGVLLPQEELGFPPLSLLYSAAVLENQGFYAGVLDCNLLNLTKKELLEYCTSFDPDIVVVVTSIQTFDQDCFLMRQLKIRFCDATIMAIGPVLKFFQERFFQLSDADCGVFAEPEGVLPILLHKICHNEDISSVKGILFKDNGQIISTGDAPLIQNLEDLPNPAWHLLPQPMKYTFTISSSRGCPHGCFYCPYIVSQGKQYRFRNPQSVVEEMRYLEKKFNARQRQFRDPIFTFLKERTKKICSLIIKEKLKVSWVIETRPEFLDFELLELLAKAGCCKIIFGVESGSNRILKSMHRLLPSVSPNSYLTHVRAITKKAKSLGIVPFSLFMLGLPDEDWNSAMETINFAKKLETVTQFSILSPYPGTAFFEIAHKEGLVFEKSLSKMTVLRDAITCTKHLTSQELEKLVRIANYETYAALGLKTILRKDFKKMVAHFGHFLRSREKRIFAKKDLYVIIEFLQQISKTSEV